MTTSNCWNSLSFEQTAEERNRPFKNNALEANLTRRRLKVSLEPFGRHLRHLLQGTVLFEQVRRSWHNPQCFRTPHLFVSLLIHRNNGCILTSHNQQGRGFNS